MADGFQPTPGQQYPHTVNTQDQSLQNYQSIIEEARQLYGNAKPSFARSSTLVKLGDTKQVVLATVDGRYPNRQDAIAFATLTAGKFNDKYNCWTMDLKGERIIVDMMACGTSSGYRQTLGVEGDSMAYTAYNVAFNVKSTAFDSASENNSSTGSSVNVAPRTRNAPSKGPKPTPRSKPPQSRNLRLHHSNLNIDDDDQRIEVDLTSSPESTHRSRKPYQRPGPDALKTTNKPNVVSEMDKLAGEELQLKRRLGAYLELEEELRDIKRRRETLQ